MTPEELAGRITATASETGAENICFTGGEPFLQGAEDIHSLCNILNTKGDFIYEVFTNGTFEFPLWTKEDTIDMQFNLDWKLPGSGEHLNKTQDEIRFKNALLLDPFDCIKFTVKDETDLDYTLDYARMLNQVGCVATYYIGRVWGCKLSDVDLIKFMEDNKLTDWKLNVQLHKFIWEPDQRGV